MKIRKSACLLLCGIVLISGCARPGGKAAAENVTEGAAGQSAAESGQSTEAGQPAAESSQPLESGQTAAESGQPSSGDTEAQGESCTHELTAKNNVVTHEEALYCGNTVTRITKAVFVETDETDEDGQQEQYIEGSDSIALTDMLRFLDYSDWSCDCIPEYYVETEFGGSYGISLSEGYARSGDKQTSLTAEQLQLIQDIMERVRASDTAQ